MNVDPGASPLLPVFDHRHQSYRERLRAVMAQWDRRATDQWEVNGHLPAEAFVTLGRAGFFSERWEEGRTRGLPYALVLAEESALVSGGLGLAVTLHSEVFLGTLHRLARTATQQSMLAAALCGDAIGCFATTESRGGSDIAGVQTLARATANGWHLTGEKRYISNAGVASHALVLARHEGQERASNLSIFVVPLRTSGVRIAGFYNKAGTHSCDAADLVFDVDLAKDALLGTQGAGPLYIMQALQSERIALAAQLVLVARTSIGLAVAHARKRQQFHRPLIQMQALRHRIADCVVELWAAESFLHSVVIAAQRGRDVSHETAALKLLCAKMAGHVVDEALQIFGGRGYTSNYPLERYWRDARLARIGAGTDEIMRELVASGVDRASNFYDEWVERLYEEDLPNSKGPH